MCDYMYFYCVKFSISISRDAIIKRDEGKFRDSKKKLEGEEEEEELRKAQ